MDNLLEEFKNLTGETDDTLVSSFILNSKRTVLSKTNRSELIDDLYPFVLKLAIARYNKQGNEGLASYNEGGESESYLTEDAILSGITNYRLSPYARRLQDEKKKSQDVSTEDKALIWPVSSKLQVELYGMRVNDMLNMHYYGSLEIKEHDMINYEGVAYKVVSIQKFKRFKAIGIEKI